MKVYFLLIIIQVSTVTAQPIVLNRSIINAKQGERQRLTQRIVSTMQLAYADSTFDRFQSAFWAIQYLQYTSPQVLKKVQQGLAQFITLTNDVQNSLLEVAYSQYPTQLQLPIQKLIQSPALTYKQYSVCRQYLYRINPRLIIHIPQPARLTSVTSAQLSIDSFVVQDAYSNKYNSTNQRKVLNALLQHKLLANSVVVISLQNQNRNYPGIVLIKQNDGKYLKQGDTTFYISQLARAITNLPYNISNGNTPQGIYRIEGLGVSSNSQIGPTSNLQLCMPYECAPASFFNSTITDTVWSAALYNTLIPPIFTELQFSFLHQAAIAGQLGRYEIIAHGSTVNTSFYNTNTYKGYTPTMGCLQAKEVWNYTTGQRLYSDQQKLVDAYISTGATKGYLVVLNIINANRAVTLYDVLK